MSEQNKQEQNQCFCPYLQEDEWDEKNIDWTGKQFLRATYKSWFYVPKEDISKVISEAYKEIARKGYGILPYGYILFKPGFFKGEIYIEIKKGSIDDGTVKTFMGQVYSKVYIGPRKDLTAVEKTFNFKPLNIYYLYFSCDVCAPDANDQKTVILGEQNYS